MKYIKQYENLNQDDPQVDDYVICIDKVSDDSELEDFIKNNIGILKIIYNRTDCKYGVFYENIPKSLNITYSRKNNNIIDFDREEIIYHSENEEDVITYIKASKYNL